MKTISIVDMKAQLGQVIGTSHWFDISQERINSFAETTRDSQFIHTDLERAKEGPFGTTIAHGFLVLSLIVDFSQQAGRMIEGCNMVINYGLEKLRFLAPVKSGKRVRAHFTLANLKEKRPGQFLIDYKITVEIEGEDKPALIVNWLCLQMKHSTSK